MFTKSPSEIIKENNDNYIMLSYNLRLAEKFKNFDEMFHVVDVSETKCFYEILSENMKRKMYFDIDINDKNELDIDKFIYEVCDIILDILPDSYMLVTKSENNETTKCGIHIIIINYYVENVYNAKRFYDNIYSNLNEEYKKYFDDKVYKSVQQFRLLFSSKINENRPKRYFKLIPTLNVKVDRKMLMNLSMIQVIDNFIELEIKKIPENKFFYIESDKKSEPINYNDSDIIEQITDEKVSKILNLVKNKIDINSFTYSSTKGIFIILKRIRASMCKNCNRIHENENAFLYEKNGNIYFGCRRNDKNYIVCAFLENDKKQDSKINKIELKNKLLDYFS